MVDASVLMNFLGLMRFELLTGLPRRFVVTEEVNTQILRNRAALDAALAASLFRLESPPLEEDAGLFGRLARTLGAADASCIAAARALGAEMVSDDPAVLREAGENLLPWDAWLGTEELLAEAVKAGLLDAEGGDALLEELATLNYRPKVQSLRGLI